MENNQEEKLQEEQVHNPEVNEQVEGNTDNLSEKEENTDKNRKNIFSRKKDKDKSKVQELEKEIEQMKAEKAELNDRFLRLFESNTVMAVAPDLNRIPSADGVCSLLSSQLFKPCLRY